LDSGIGGGIGGHSGRASRENVSTEDYQNRNNTHPKFEDLFVHPIKMSLGRKEGKILSKHLGGRDREKLDVLSKENCRNKPGGAFRQFLDLNAGKAKSISWVTGF